jgi:hypothetical protein
MLKLMLLIGGLFNLSMGFIFLSNRLLQAFFSWAQSLEKSLFGSEVILALPVDPVHQLFIHGFGAGVVILGVTLIYAARKPQPLVPFILFDGLGRLIFGSIMFYYVMSFSLMRTILLFGVVEFSFGLIYIWGSLVLMKQSRDMVNDRPYSG